jgi:N-carbamoylputrescine amidase
MSNEIRILRVAAVQIRSKNGRIERNLERAVPYIEKAAGEGAELVMLPDFLSTGYAQPVVS